MAYSVKTGIEGETVNGCKAISIDICKAKEKALNDEKDDTFEDILLISRIIVYFDKAEIGY